MSASTPTQSLQGPTKTWKQPSGERLWTQAQTTFATYLKSPPQNYVHQPVQPRDDVLKLRQATYRQAHFPVHSQGRPFNHNGRENTREYYDSKNARDKPDDGITTKLEGDKAQCLTCINQGATCHGTDVVGGKCRGCRGENKDGKRTRQIRICRWREPENEIFTYLDHKTVYPKGKDDIKQAEPAGISRNNNGVEGDEINESNDNIDHCLVLEMFITVYDIADTYAKQVLNAMVATVFDGGWTSDEEEANIGALLSVAQECFEKLPTDRVQCKAAVEEVHDILTKMLLLGHFINYQGMSDLLPNSHPAYTGNHKEESGESGLYSLPDTDAERESDDWAYAGRGGGSDKWKFNGSQNSCFRNELL